MTRSEARAAVDAGVTWESLREHIARRRSEGGLHVASAVNDTMTVAQALDILAAGVGDRTGTVDPMTSYHLIAVNVLRECAS